jgi:thymidylate synthase (FAD)
MNQTNRPISPGMEEMLGVVHEVLDHGKLWVVDYMGNDDAIVQAARVSYGEGTTAASDDETLIRYLKRHRHTTPFEMCEIKIGVELPVFVARQWIRHRTANVNEYSARYSIVPDKFYVPSLDQVRAQSTVNKQGRGEPLDVASAERFRHSCKVNAAVAFSDYKDAIEAGVARELARSLLPVSMYTRWYWKIDLHNLMHFQSLRNDPHAQYEIRVYAETIHQIMEAWVPRAMRAWKDYVGDAHTFSGPEMEVIRDIVSRDDGPRASFPPGVGKREQLEFTAALRWDV